MTKTQRGDTIIEVLMAVVVFSLVAVGAITLMNSGIAMAQRSLETTLVRQQIDAQADMLRYVADHARLNEPQFSALWADITSATHVTATPKSLLNADTCPADADIPARFTLRPTVSAATGDTTLAKSVAYQQAPSTYARVNGANSEGISVQLNRVSGGRAYDAYIQACWYGPGQSRPMTIGTIVRIYDEKA